MNLEWLGGTIDECWIFFINFQVPWVNSMSDFVSHSLNRVTTFIGCEFFWMHRG